MLVLRDHVCVLLGAGTEFVLFAIPVSVIQYMPNFFFGALLMLFGIEIILDWLILSYRKVCGHHYSICRPPQHPKDGPLGVHPRLVAMQITLVTTAHR